MAETADVLSMVETMIEAHPQHEITEGKKKLDLVRHSVLSLALHGQRYPMPLCLCNRGEKKLDLVRHSVLSFVLHDERVPLHLLYARYDF